MILNFQLFLKVDFAPRWRESNLVVVRIGFDVGVSAEGRARLRGAVNGRGAGLRHHQTETSSTRDTGMMGSTEIMMIFFASASTTSNRRPSTSKTVPIWGTLPA
jgi:hypothetical protein